ncbi:MAG: hypothetical protein KIT88_13510, partial [Phycisphaeraceae bacterium]|nr:hypothetical protein [Phycisphaeraceae bacterium]
SIVGSISDQYALAGLVSVTLDEDNEGYLVLEELFVGGLVAPIARMTLAVPPLAGSSGERCR